MRAQGEGGGQAFPSPFFNDTRAHEGMTLRQWYAGKAITGAAWLNVSPGWIAHRAVQIADALILEEEKPSPATGAAEREARAPARLPRPIGELRRENPEAEAARRWFQDSTYDSDGVVIAQVEEDQDLVERLIGFGYTREPEESSPEDDVEARRRML